VSFGELSCRQLFSSVGWNFEWKIKSFQVKGMGQTYSRKNVNTLQMANHPVKEQRRPAGWNEGRRGTTPLSNRTGSTLARSTRSHFEIGKGRPRAGPPTSTQPATPSTQPAAPAARPSPPSPPAVYTAGAVRPPNAAPYRETPAIAPAPTPTTTSVAAAATER
jgi:hypothetical protein